MDLQLRDLTIALDGHEIVRRLSLEVGAGTVVGLVGPNGSGKSTVLRSVYGALRPNAGAVVVDDTDLVALSRRDAARRIAAMPQDAGTDLDFTVAELVALGRAPHLHGNRALGPDDRLLVDRAMERLDVRHLAGRGVLSLSGGERQRVVAARALAQDPELLVLDEPTNHLDVRHQLDLLAVLRDSGATVLVVLHDLNLAAAVCDRIGVLADGALAAAGPPVEVLTEELVARVFGVATRVVRHPDTGAVALLFTLPAHSPDRSGAS